MQATTVSEALRASLAGTFGTVLSVLPRLVVFAIALAAGWAISSLLARATIAALRAVRFDEMARRSGLARFIQHMGVQRDPTGAVAVVTKWLVRLMTLVVALDALGLPAGSGVLHQLLLWLPNLAVGLVALVVGGLTATALSRLVLGLASVAGLPNPQVLATATGIAVWAFAIVLAVSQLGIATSVVNLGLLGVVGGLALAAGIAFGWAGRERAAQLLSSLEGRHASPLGVGGAESPGAESPGAESPGAESLGATTSLASAMVSSESPVVPVTAPMTAGDNLASAADAALDAPVSPSATAPSTSARLTDIDASTPPPGPADLAPQPVLDPSAPAVDASASELDRFGPAFDASEAEFDPSALEFDSAAPQFDAQTLDAHASEVDAHASEVDAHASEVDAPLPALHASPPALDRFAPLLDRFADEGALLPEDELDLEPARAVAFEESWIPRSGHDRRRIARLGPDRRAGGA